MKILNFRLLMFGLFTLVSVFFISCEQEKLTEDLTQSVEVEHEHFLMPKGFGEKTIEDQENLIANLTDSEIEEYEANLKIAIYLEHIEKYETTYEELEIDQAFTEISLENYLTDNEMQELNQFDAENEIESRGVCTPWWHYYTEPGDCLEPGWCCEWKSKWRSCWNFNGSYIERVSKYYNMCW